MMESEKRVSLFGNNVDLIDASFTSYLNEKATVLKVTHPLKKNVEEEEIGIFGAEKYFKGAMDEELPRTPQPVKPENNDPKNPKRKDEKPSKPKTESGTPSVRSESSWNSRSELLGNNGGNRIVHRSRREKSRTVKSLLASLGCNCNDKASVTITENRVHIAKPPAKDGGFDEKMNKKREDCFAFPVQHARLAVKTAIPEEGVEGDVNVNVTRIRTRRNSSEVFGSPVLEKGKKSFSLERKLTMLNWDGVTPKGENVDISNNAEGNDAASDASSDLFEIESFSTNGNNSFLARQVSNGRSTSATTIPNGYASSEASIAWSVVTASVTGFSIISDYEDSRALKSHNVERMIKGGGILSGCNSHKSVRVAGEHLVVGGGDKAGVTGGTTAAKCAGPVVKFQAETKPMSLHSPRASHHLYIQQQ